MTALRIGVLGAGNWGSVLASLAGENGHDVRLWTRHDWQAEEINSERTNKKAVPELTLPEKVRATTSLKEAIEEAQLVVGVVPSQAMREVMRAAGDVLQPDQVVLHATKGLERGTHKRMSEIIVEETCVRQVGVVSGPNIAGEIALGQPAGTVVASHFPRAVALGRAAFASRRMMVFAGTDVLGIELAGAFKNVVALAAGMATAMGLGENAKSLLVTRGMAEMTRLATALGAQATTLGGLAGFGDLMVTCNSTRSRNHRVGEALGRGESLDEVLSSLGQVAEGVHTAVTVKELSKLHGVATPLMERVYRVLYEGLSPAKGLDELMVQPTGHDVAHFGR